MHLLIKIESHYSKFQKLNSQNSTIVVQDKERVMDSTHHRPILSQPDKYSANK